MKKLKQVCKLNIQFAAAMIIAVFALAGCKEDDPVKVSGVSLNKTTLELAAGGSETLTATVAPADAENKAVTWSSSDGVVATVDATGKVTAVKAGTATITVATSDGGLTATCAVTVTAAENNDDDTSGENNEGEKPGTATLRYETVPYSASEAKSDEHKLIYSASDDEYNYYLFLLGHVISVPLAYIDATYYNGVTPIDVSYSQTNVTEQSISQSIGTAAEHSFTESSSVNLETGGQAGIDLEWFSLEASAKLTTTTGWDVTNSRSRSNTFEISRSTVAEMTQARGVRVGDHGEPVGAYRWALFATTDVYYYVVTDKARTSVVGTYTEFCARPNPLWILDYEPDENAEHDSDGKGYFGKTAGGELLEIPEINPSTLPDPDPEDIHVHDWGEWVVTKEPTCTTPGEEVRTCKLVSSHTEKRDIPATGHLWSDWVVTKEPVGTAAGEKTKTCEYCGLEETDDFTGGYSGSINSDYYVNTSSDIYSWQPPKSEFDIEGLKALGYKSVDVKIDFRIKSDGIQGSECWVKVYKGRTATQSNTNMWVQGGRYDMGAVLPWDLPPWKYHSLTTNVPLDNYDNEFSINFVRSGIFNFIVGSRTVTVTAKK